MPSEALRWGWEKSCRTKPGGKLPSVKCRTSGGAVKASVGESGEEGSASEEGGTESRKGGSLPPATLTGSVWSAAARAPTCPHLGSPFT